MAIYLITRDGAPDDEKPRIVEARTKPAAISLVAKDMFAAEVMSTKEAMAWAAQGVELEEIDATKNAPSAE